MAKVSVQKENVTRKMPHLALGWHRVTLNYSAWSAYFQSQRDGSIGKHEQVTAWLKANLRKGQWIYHGYYGGSIFDFKTQSDAVQFSLIWGG